MIPSIVWFLRPDIVPGLAKVDMAEMGFGLGYLLSKIDMVSTSDHASVVSINLFVALLCTCIVLGHLLEENRWMNESITALLIVSLSLSLSLYGYGLCTGIVILLTSGGTNSHLLVFSEDLFFIYLLPPIIFNAGFQVKKKQFFRNFMTITLFGAIGTLISFAIVSFGAMNFFKNMNIAIGAIFSATDSVCTLQVLNQDETPLLYSLVFGEGVVNDATSVVLFNAIQSFDVSHIKTSIVLQFVGNFLYLLLSSTVLGVVAGLLSAYIIKKLYFGRHSTDREVALMMLMAYLSYMLAELFYLSAILTVFFCGIVMSHYTWHNVTESSRVTTKHAFATLSFVSLGRQLGELNTDGTGFDWKSSLRFPIIVYIQFDQEDTGFQAPFLCNYHIICSNFSCMQFTKGGHTQLRGNAFMITSTITVVLFSTVVFGLLTKPLVRLLLPSPKQLSRALSSEPTTPKSFIVPLLSNGQDSEVDLAPHVPRPSACGCS
ncbi:hypothetical protein C3L33_14885, partial [Rhododendron williamsianum]